MRPFYRSTPKCVNRLLFLLLLPVVLGTGPGSPPRQPKPLKPIFSATYSQTFDGELVDAGRSGGFTAAFTRSGASTRNLRSTGVVGTTVVDGAAAIGSPLLAGQPQTLEADGLWMGPSITYEGLENEAIDTWTDVGTPVKTANAVSAPNGGLVADRIEDDSGAGEEGVLHTAVIAGTTDIFVATVWHRCVSTHVLSINLAIGAGSTAADGTCTTTWTKLRVSQAGDGATLLAILTLHPVQRGNVANQGVAEFWRPQLFRLGTTTDPATWYPDVEPLIADTTEVAIGNDNMNYTGGFGPMLVGGMTTCVWVNAKEYIADTYHLFSWNDTNDYSVGIIEGATDRIEVVVNTSTDDGNVNTAGVTIVNGAWHHVCVAVLEVASADNSLTIYLDGAAVADGASTDRAWTDGESTYGTSMAVGITEGVGKPLGGYVSRPRVWNRAFQAAQIAQVYNRELFNYQ